MYVVEYNKIMKKLMYKNFIQNKQGFTIIEVVLVLAIAGLIFAMVFIALPALQRSQRKKKKKSHLTSLAGQLNNAIGNARGKLISDYSTNN